MIETLLGGLLGGAFRLAPEVLKWLDRKGERSHPSMRAIAGSLSDQDIADLAAYYGSK